MDNLGFSIFMIAMLIVGFLLFREVICWYFKINERLDISKQILAEIKIINEGKGK